MPDLTQVEKAIEAAADAAVKDVVSAVQSHPDYQGLIEQLAVKALAALAAGL